MTLHFTAHFAGRGQLDVMLMVPINTSFHNVRQEGYHFDSRGGALVVEIVVFASSTLVRSHLQCITGQ